MLSFEKTFRSQTRSNLKVNFKSENLGLKIKGRNQEETDFFVKFNYKKIDEETTIEDLIHSKYDQENNSIITGLNRVSTPGFRRYVGRSTIPRVFNNLGVSIITTSKGVMTGMEARRAGIGGEVLCYVW